jgi:recombination protein RecT
MTTDIATQPTHAPAKREKPIDKFCSLIDAKQGTFAAALPAQIPFERFRSVVISALALDPKLLNADQGTLFTACLQAASDGLLPNKKEAALVVYKTKVKDESGKDKWIEVVQYMPMIAGIRKKMRQSGEVSSFTAQCVYEGEEFEFEHGSNQKLVHKPIYAGKRGGLLCVYAHARLKDGTEAFQVMHLDDVDRRKAVSKSAQYGGPWRDWYPEMALKTVSRQLLSVLPSNSDIDRLVEHMDQDTNLTRPRSRVVDDDVDIPQTVVPSEAEGEVIE